MRIIVTGARGLVGEVLVEHLEKAGHEVVPLGRRAKDGALTWNPEATGEDAFDAQAVGDVDGVVHLAGEPIANGRWTEKRKARIRSSRVDGTRALSRALAALPRPPRVMVSASAIGFYGDRGAERLDESSSLAGGFLPEVCGSWEEACAPLHAAGTRVVNMRIGIVLSSRGGALKKMLLPFKLGLGGVLGDGEQYMSWIAIDDLAAAFLFALETESLSGPVNAVAPTPCTNREFTKTLGRTLGRPTVLPMPAAAARFLFGELADPLLLASARVIPTRLQGSGFTWRHPELQRALQHVIGMRA